MSHQPRSAAAPPSPETVRLELQRILTSPVFANASRAQRFLTYVVEQTLAGQQDSIKELILGMVKYHSHKPVDEHAFPAS